VSSNIFFSPESEPVPLKNVKTQFAQWRATRVKGKRIPNTLWELVLPLTKKYGYKKVATELDLNPHRLRAKMEKQSQQISSLEESDFGEVPLPSLSSPFPQSSHGEQKIFIPCGSTSLEFTRSDGTILKASGLNHKDLCSLIKGFLGQ
jgi:hypothetical protein